MFKITLTTISVVCVLLSVAFAATQGQAFELTIDSEAEVQLDYRLSLNGEPFQSAEPINREILRNHLLEELQRNDQLKGIIESTTYEELIANIDPLLQEIDLASSEDVNFQSLGLIGNGNGLAAAIANLALSDLFYEALCRAKGGTVDNPTHPASLIMSNLRAHINPDIDAAHLDFRTKKTITCNVRGQKISNTFTRRWVINILNGGILGMVIPNPTDKFKYRLYSVGIPIRMMAYYEQGVLVTRLDANGSPDRRYRYYGVTNEACIYIKLVDVPTNDRDIVSRPSDIAFCAGGCGIPGVDATM